MSIDCCQRKVDVIGHASAVDEHACLFVTAEQADVTAEKIPVDRLVAEQLVEFADPLGLEPCVRYYILKT